MLKTSYMWLHSKFYCGRYHSALSAPFIALYLHINDDFDNRTIDLAQEMVSTVFGAKPMFE